MLAVAGKDGVGVGGLVVGGTVVGVETAAVSVGRAAVPVVVATGDGSEEVTDGGGVAVVVAGTTAVADVGEGVGFGPASPPSPPQAATNIAGMTQSSHFTTNHLHETGQAKAGACPGLRLSNGL
jgi:hypothetical protein